MTLPIPAAPSPDPALDRRLGDELTVVHRFLPRAWGRQHVVEAGPPDAPPVVLLHGWPQHWFAYRHVITALAATHRVIAIDTRAFGWSTTDEVPAQGTITATSLALDVVATLDDLDIATAHLVGHDWGGWFAFHVALAHPQRITGLTTMAIMPPWLHGRAVLRGAIHLGYLLPMAIVGREVARSPRAVAAMVRYSTGVEGTWDGDDGRAALTAYGEQLFWEHAQVATRRLYARMVRTELLAACRSPRPARLAMPAEVWLGEREQIAQPEMFLPRTHPDELVVRQAPGAGHWLLDEAPAWVVAQLQAQLSG